jgi:hypothetical protein
MRSSFFESANVSQVVWQTLAGDAPSYEIDGERTLLPWPTDLQLDASRQRVHIDKIRAGTSGAAADLLELDLRWFRNGTFYAWSVFGPDTDDVQLPALPLILGAGLGLTSEDNPQAGAILYEADNVSGYDAVRANIDKVLVETFGSMPRGPTQRTRVATNRVHDVFAGR